ncbi:hypothetical protein FMN63_21885 [Stappia sp. BW2]|nr:hypothetical protein FMN63_21885 [Stappia sp. BW2]
MDPRPDGGEGQSMKPEQMEIDRLRNEVAKRKSERDILQMAAAPAPGPGTMRCWPRIFSADCLNSEQGIRTQLVTRQLRPPEIFATSPVLLICLMVADGRQW